MDFLNETLVWLMKKRLPRIQAFMDRPMDTQETMFWQLIQTAKNTEWGKKYDFRSISSIRDFQQRVPISSYEDLFPFIERIMKGEQNVLWPSNIQHFAKSSGTTNARSKFIPVSKECLDDCHFMGGKDMMTLLVENKPDTEVFSGKGLSIGGSLSSNQLNSRSVMGDVSAVVMKNLPIWAQIIRTPSLDVALMDVWEEKIQKMAEVTSQENVTSILGVPTWTLVLIDKILEITGKDNILEVWPNFEFFIHGAVAFHPYRDMFRNKVFPSESVNYLEIYNASEGFFGVQDDISRKDEMMLMLDYGIFYEFIPMEEIEKEYPKAVSLEEVEIGKNYAIIISTNAGLWRYKIGDTIRFTTKYPYRFKISGRTKQFINAFGEEIIVENSDIAITKACEATGAIINDYTAGPVYMDGGKSGCHEWIIEFDQEPNNQEVFNQVLDQTLRSINSDYDAKRYKDMVLTPPKINVVQKETFYSWMRSKGKLGGQHKVPRLCNSREYLDSVLAVVNQNNTANVN
ncbi:GH3 auxin-responsive promoter family protein [Flectobacillus longus]|uniref:GH3 auxin-responsive promoter family protein n=1 Tax=Flectobacillus longus TaxID=2984207 RepID=UPI0024B7D0D3|nr:GH3 auxin-responsive promoter family protein [Flectobacillus longus]MDI9881734.1 GH3 auxin-responsive promoter family protein [Flectobacillus longus]